MPYNAESAPADGMHCVVDARGRHLWPPGRSNVATRRPRRPPLASAAMKHVWGLGAAVLSLLLVVIFWTVYVTGRLATTERLAPSEMAEGIDVPVIGTVGDFPEPEHRHVVNVTAEGRIIVDGNVVSFEEVDERMTAWAKLSEVWYSYEGNPIEKPIPEKSYSLSGEHLLLRIDARLPWGAANELLYKAADRRLLRIWLVVRHEGDGEEGALGYPDTLDGLRRDSAASMMCIPDRPGYGVDVQPGAGEGSPALMCRTLQALPPSKWGNGKFDVRLQVHGSQPVGAVMQLWDAAMRSKASAVGIFTIGPRAPFKSAIGAPAAGGPYSIWLSSAPQAGRLAPGPMPPVPRTRGLQYTFAPWWNFPPDEDAEGRRLLAEPK